MGASNQLTFYLLKGSKEGTKTQSSGVDQVECWQCLKEVVFPLFTYFSGCCC